MNDIETHHGHITEKERDTARLLLAEGHPRWLVAAMLGRHPLAFNGTGRRPADNRRKTGAHLNINDARRDNRQMGLEEWEPPTTDDTAE